MGLGVAYADVSIISDSLYVDTKTGESHFTDHVRMTRDDITMTADRLILKKDDLGNEFAKAYATIGSRIQLKRQVKSELLKGYANIADYDSKKEQVMLQGNALIERYICGKLKDKLEAKTIIYDMKRQSYSAQGGQEKVKTLIIPQSVQGDCKG